MECPAPGSAIEAAARAAAGVGHGVDLNHRCDVEACKFRMVQQRLKRNGRSARVFVCIKSLHVHWCGNHVCGLPGQLRPSCAEGAWTCPISGLEVQAQDEVHCLTKTKTHGRPDSWHNSASHTETQKCRTAKARKRGKTMAAARRERTARCMTAALLKVLLASPETKSLRKLAQQRKERAVSIAVSKAGSGFIEQMHAARQAYPLEMADAAVHDKVVSALAASIDDFVARIKPQLKVCKGQASVVASCCSFLRTGMTRNNVVMFPKLQWLEAVLPDPADFGKIPGFQCRPVSITSRNIKAAMHGANGFPNAALLFKCPEWICTPGIPQPEF